MNTKNTTIVSLSHRLNTGLNTDSPITPAKLHDCMNPALERAAGIADLMEVAFKLNMANDLTNLWRPAQAIRFEILDAQAMLNAYVDSQRARPEVSLQDSQGGE